MKERSSALKQILPILKNLNKIIKKIEDELLKKRYDLISLNIKMFEDIFKKNKNTDSTSKTIKEIIK